MNVRSIGLCSYQEVWNLQRALHSDLVKGEAEETLIVCQHPPTITLGKSAKAEHVLASAQDVAQRGVTVFTVERGGDVTYHGPGQLVAYPIIDLSRRRKDVGWYMRLLEQAVIDSLAAYNLEGSRIAGKTGVWIASAPHDRPATDYPRKISSLGIKLSKWCSTHGLSLNIGSVENALSLEEGFSLINPCGLGDVYVTSVEKELSRSVDHLEFEGVLTKHLQHLLAY